MCTTMLHAGFFKTIILKGYLQGLSAITKESVQIMERKELGSRRYNWEATLEEDGMVYSIDHSDPEDTHYWNEFASFTMKPDEREFVSAQVEEMERMCMAAVDHIVNSDLVNNLQLGDLGLKIALDSWERREPAFYGRMDFVYDSQKGSLKFLEYNADTPTSILEAGIIQKRWFVENGFEADGYSEFNNLMDSMVERWSQLKHRLVYPILHLACVQEPSGEDIANLEAVSAAANKAGITTRIIHIEELIWNEERRLWEDAEGVVVKNLFKLYPWEDLVNDLEYDENGNPVLDAQGNPVTYMTFEKYQAMDNWFEPAWKMFLSTKVLLVALWELFPNHPLLVQAGFTADGMRNWVRKPFFGREGAGLTISAPDYGVHIKSRDDYMEDVASEDEYVYQEYVHVPEEFRTGTEANLLTMGAWVVNSRHVGFSLRESEYRITDGICRFVPFMVDTTNR